MTEEQNLNPQLSPLEERPLLESKKRAIFKNVSAKATFLFGLVLGITIIVLIGLAVLLFLSSKNPVYTYNQNTATNTNVDTNQNAKISFDAPDKDKAVLKFFVMAFCPYGQQAESSLISIAKLFANKALLEPHFVIYDNYGDDKTKYCLDKSFKYCSMHGTDEVKEDVRQLCLWKYQPAKWWDYVSEMNNTCSVSNVSTCWEQVAQKTGVNISRIKTCQANEAYSLLAKEVALNTKYNAHGSPQIFINDQEYSEGRTAEALKQALCSGFKNPPTECSQALSAQQSTTAGNCGN